MTFGTRHGPAALEAAVRALVAKALTQNGYDQRNLWIRYYLDDITIIGEDAERFSRDLCDLAFVIETRDGVSSIDE